MSQRHEVRAWRQQASFDANTATLRADAHRVRLQLDQMAPNVLNLHTVCGVFLNDLAAANSSLPTPDSTASALLARAYGDLGAAGTLCYHDPATPAKRARALRWLVRGANELLLGATRLRAVS